MPVFQDCPPGAPEVALAQKLFALLNAEPCETSVALNVLISVYRAIVHQIPEQHDAAIQGCMELARELIVLRGGDVMAAPVEAAPSRPH